MLNILQKNTKTKKKLIKQFLCNSAFPAFYSNPNPLSLVAMQLAK